MKTSEAQNPQAGPVGEFRYTRYPVSVPPVDAGIDTAPCAVAIVGGGPVGLALALGLAGWNIPSVVIEADDTVCIGSRAACISRRSLEIVDGLGALPAFLGKGLAWTGGRSFYKTDEVYRFQMPHDERQRLPPMINLQQYYIEQFLVDAIVRRNAASPGARIDLRWGSEVTGFSRQADGVDISVHCGQDDYRMRAGWMVACDGGQSLVRKELGLPLVGTAYEGRYVIIDIHLPSAHPAERRAWFDPPWNPGSTVLMHRQVDDIWRVDYQLKQGLDTDTALQPENVRRFVQKHLDAIGEGHLPWETIWTSVYRAGAMTLESYRHGRVLFAGNAAHAMPIFGVRGLNSGFDDAFNLAWKLALVVRGQAGDTLLDSYSQERIAGFHINAESAMRSTEFMSPPSRGFELLREAALSLAGRHRDIARLINPRQTEAVPYPGSTLSTPDRSALPGAAPGHLLPDFPLLDPRGHLTEQLRPGFTLLAFSRTATLAAEITTGVDSLSRTRLPSLQCFQVLPPAEVAPAEPSAASSAADVSWLTISADPAVLDSHIPGGAAITDVVLYLLRPDRHVAARWHLHSASPAEFADFGDQLGAALRRSCGLAATQPAVPVSMENRS